MKTHLMLLFMLATMGWLVAQPSKFPPPNDMGKDKSLVAFVTQLKAAVKKKDQAFLLSVMDKNIKNGFGGNDGIEEFKKQWNWPQDTLSLWHHLQHVLNIGGGFIQAEPGVTPIYAFPYVFNLDAGEGDIFSLGVITGKNVNFREKPDLKAKVIAQLTYDVVTFLGETRGENEVGEPEWRQIETANKKKGWVFWKYVYSPVSYRLLLNKNQQGKWKITAFLAGD